MQCITYCASLYDSVLQVQLPLEGIPHENNNSFKSVYLQCHVIMLGLKYVPLYVSISSYIPPYHHALLYFSDE